MNSGSSPSTPLPPQLCSGTAVEYKAFSRVLYPDSGASVICVLANCSFPHTNFSLSFDDSKGLALMESLAPGEYSYLINSCGAGWSSPQAMAVPKTITVKDAFGEHTIPVKPW